MKFIPKNNKCYTPRTPAKSAVHDNALELKGGSLINNIIPITEQPRITELPRLTERNTRISPKKLVSI